MQGLFCAHTSVITLNCITKEKPIIALSLIDTSCLYECEMSPPQYCFQLCIIKNSLFWRLFQNKNKTVNNNVCNEIKFSGIVFRDPESICHEWGRHFASLYSDTE